MSQSQIRLYAGFEAGTSVLFTDKNGKKFRAIVADKNVGKVLPGLVPIVVIPDGYLIFVPASRLGR